MQKWRQWENADQDAWQLALEREAVIRPLAEQGRLSPTLVQDATRQLRLSRSVLYDLLRRYKQRPQTSSLLPWKRGRATKATFLESTREELLNSSIQDFYLRPERPSLAALLQEVRRRFSEQNLPAPHYRVLLPFFITNEIIGPPRFDCWAVRDLSATNVSNSGI
jgi:putative transposase